VRRIFNRYRRAAAGFFLTVALVAGGCGGESAPAIVPAQGVVLLGGAPLPNAQVRFIPSIDLGAEYIASGVTDAQGRYTLECNGQPGACAAEHIVVVTEADIPAQLQSENAQRELAAYLKSLKNRPIPQNYSTLVSTPLRITVSEGQPEYNLELKR
jgi:hypothetical protein